MRNFNAPMVALVALLSASCEETKPGEVCLSKGPDSRSTCAGSKCLMVDTTLHYPAPTYPLPCIGCADFRGNGAINQGLYVPAELDGARWEFKLEGDGFEGVHARGEEVLALDLKGKIHIDARDADPSGLGLLTRYEFTNADIVSLSFAAGRIKLVALVKPIFVSQLLRPAAPECLPYVVTSCSCNWNNPPADAERRRFELDIPYDATTFAQ